MPARAKKKGVMNMKKKNRCLLAAIFGKLLRKRSGATCCSGGWDMDVIKAWGEELRPADEVIYWR